MAFELTRQPTGSDEDKDMRFEACRIEVEHQIGDQSLESAGLEVVVDLQHAAPAPQSLDLRESITANRSNAAARRLKPGPESPAGMLRRGRAKGRRIGARIHPPSISSPATYPSARAARSTCGLEHPYG